MSKHTEKMLNSSTLIVSRVFLMCSFLFENIMGNDDIK
jgi:preprotein translocase subunit SecG